MPCPTCNSNEKEACLECAYCNEMLFCDEACKSIGWSAHQCNVVEVPRANMTVFMPYVGEDMMDDEMLAQVSDEVFQSKIVRYVNPKGIVEQRLVEGKAAFTQGGSKLGRGPSTMPDSVQSTSYTIGIELIRDAFSGDAPEVLILDDNMTFGDDSIWKGAGGLAGSLAKGNVMRSITSDASSYILWPNPARVQKAIATRSGGFDIPASGGSMKISVNVAGRAIASIHGVYSFEKTTGGGAGFFKRTLRRLNPLQTEFQKKFKRGDPMVGASLQNLEALRGTDAEGNTVQLIFEVTRSKDGVLPTNVRLLDIEYRVNMRRVQDAVLAKSAAPIPTFVNTPLAFQCDPSDLDHVTGLVMALEDKLAAGELEGPLIQHQFDVINTHRQMLELDENVEITPKINAAVQGATAALWENVGAQSKQKYYLDKLSRGGPATAESLAKKLMERMQKARSATGIKKLTAKAVKSKTRRDLEDLDQAITQMMRQAGLAEETKSAYAQVQEDYIVVALRPE